MPRGQSRTYRARVEEISRLQKKHGLTDEKLAAKTELSGPTISRALNGEKVYLSTIQAIADVFKVDCDTLIEGYASLPPNTAQDDPRYLINGQVRFTGVIPNSGNPTVIPEIALRISEIVKEAGLQITSIHSETTLIDLRGDAVARVIVLVYGWLDNGKPFWVFVSIRPSRYPAFLAAQERNEIDLYHFEPFGEIIVSGDTESPPDEVLLHISRQFNTTVGDLDHTVAEANTTGRPVSHDPRRANDGS
jgi:hypothetical protein